MIDIELETGVSVVFSAAHYEKNGRRRLHGHTYEVRAWFPAGQDAVKTKKELQRVVKPLDHSLLPNDMCWSEDIAKHVILALPGATLVEVNRDREGFFGRARRKIKAEPLVDRSHKWWTNREVDRLRELLRDGMGRKAIARMLGRTRDSVKGQIERLRAAGENV